MIDSTQQFLKQLDDDNVNYDYRGASDSGKDIVVIRFKSNVVNSISVQMFFHPDGEDVALRIFNLITVPEVKTARILAKLNELNARFRFSKFCLDTEDSTVQMEMDCPFRTHDVGPVCSELLARAVTICEDALPELLKAAWSD